MLVLGIESSCDETAVALVDQANNVLSSVVSSQVKIHAPFGGVVPEVAARNHLYMISPLLEKALTKADRALEDIELIAVTQGPGLVGALLVGASFARGLSQSLNLPIVPVDHVHAHVYSAFLDKPQLNFANIFPSLALVVSGGHTNLYYMENKAKFELIASTIDDACGECFDKVGKMFDLPYPAGPYVDKLAVGGDINRYEMPKIMNDKNKMMFSYSGLKTHMFYLMQRLGEKEAKKEMKHIFSSFQHEAFSQLVRKIKIIASETEVKSLILGGGVAVNSYLQELFRREFKFNLFFPEKRYCGDNAAMIASYGAQVYADNFDNHDFKTENWEIYSRYKFQDYMRESRRAKDRKES